MYLRQPVSSETSTPTRATFFSAFRFAWMGVSHVLRTQRNARIHLGVGTAVIAAAVALQIAAVELAMLVVCITMVVAAEMMNTVVEATVDLVSPSYHPLAKIAKDVAAGAVLVCAIGAAVIGAIVLGPHLWHAVGR